MASVIHPSGLAQRHTGTVPGGGQHAPGSGRADGGDVGAAGRSLHHDGLRFDYPVPNSGYIWWYIDALSADGRHGLTLIAFIGSVFSPYYAWARRSAGPAAGADPMNHCALNVALYGPRAARWSMTERGAAHVVRDSSHLKIGRSELEWTGSDMAIAIDEVCAPIPRRVRGSIRLTPSALGDRAFLLDAAGRHRWTPFAPYAHIEVRLAEPSLTWSGIAYLDSNVGVEPLENAFRYWTWSRASVPGGTVVLYDVSERAGPAQPLALRFGTDAIAEAVEPPPVVALPASRWRVARQTRADSGHGARVVETFEDAPFYSRSLLDTRLFGSPAAAIHESLDLDRFSSAWVQCLLPFRMPRRIF
jgi:carotenoid 1,2-hydratase